MAVVTNETQFQEAIDGLEPEITVANDITISYRVSISYAVNITGEQGVSLHCAIPSGTSTEMFRITQDGMLTIGSLIIDGDVADCTLVSVSGGTFTMEEGAVLQNVKSVRGSRAVTIGAPASAAGGAFIMNGGLITGIESYETVFCYGGTVTMDNEASISGNTATGITVAGIYSAPYTRSTLTMTGKSGIRNNKSPQPGGGVVVYSSDVIMGVEEGDEPIVSGNETDYYGGGLIIAEDSSLTMDYGAEVSDNYSAQYSGGVVAQEAAVKIGGRASIKNNTAATDAAGLTIIGGGSTVIEGESDISGNSSKGKGGGIFFQGEGTFDIKGNATISGNTAREGAGMYLHAGSVSIGTDNSFCAIYNNAAEDLGGGIFISEGASLLLTGRADIYGNIASKGAGVYKAGELRLSRGPRISDGLFFDDFTVDAVRSEAPEAPSNTEPPALVIGEGEYAREVYIKLGGEPGDGGLTLSGGEPRQAYLGYVPIIADVLTSGAEIQLEYSGCVSPPNVPAVIAEKGEDYERLGETDRAAWLIPPEFGPGYAVNLNYEQDWVLIDYEVYLITCLNLCGADNPNPGSYSLESEFPIVLAPPGEREGYLFMGWYDANGQPVTEITEGAAGDIILIAMWREAEKYCLTLDGNAPCVSRVPGPVYGEPGEWVKIPDDIPKKPRHCFVGWNTEPLGEGTDYPPGGRILITQRDAALYALWRPLCGFEAHKEPPYCPRRRKC